MTTLIASGAAVPIELRKSKTGFRVLIGSIGDVGFDDEVKARAYFDGAVDAWNVYETNPRCVECKKSHPTCWGNICHDCSLNYPL